MFFYLKKFWKVNLLAVLFQMFQNSGRVIWSLLMILLFQQVIELNFKGVVFFCVIELVVSGEEMFAAHFLLIFKARRSGA